MNTEEVHFFGQQDGERVLYLAQPHKFFLLLKLLRNTLILTLFILGWLRSGSYISLYSPNLYAVVSIGQVVIYFASIWWLIRFYNRSKVYITDRRIIRFIPSFPVTEKRRMIFWRDVLKTRSVSDDVISRLLQVGTIEVVPKTGIEQSLIIANVSYFEDLGNYFDKLVYLTNSDPEELRFIKPFIALPKWKRYPVEDNSLEEVLEAEDQILITNNSQDELKAIEYIPKVYLNDKKPR